MYIELIGLPGAGKTTLVNRLLESSEVKDKLVNLSNYKSRVLRKKGWKIKFIFFLLFNSFSVFQILKHSLTASVNRKKSLKRIVSLFVLLFVLKQFKKTEKILLMDQAVIQMLVSIFIYNKKYEEGDIDVFFNKCMYIIKTKKKDYIKIGVEVPLEEAIYRIKSRPKHNCEFKNMEEGKCKAVLKAYKYFFKLVVFDLTCFTKEPLEKNIEKLNSFIINKK